MYITGKKTKKFLFFLNSEQIVLEYKRRGRATICSSSSFDSHLLFMILFLSFPIFFHFTTKKLSATWWRICDGICSCLNGLSNTFFRWTTCRNDRKFRIFFTKMAYCFCSFFTCTDIDNRNTSC